MAIECLRAVGAFYDFVDGEIGDHRGNGDGVPDELALGGSDRWSAVTLGARALRPLRLSVGVEDDAIRAAFGNLAHVIIDGDRERPACAPDDQFFRSQDCNPSDGGLIGVRANYGRTDAQGKSIRIGGLKSGRAGCQCCGGAVVILRKRGHARTGEEQPCGSGANLNATGLFGAESVATENGRADRSLRGAYVGAVREDDNAERRRRSSPDGRGQKREREEQGEDAFRNRNAVIRAGDCERPHAAGDCKKVDARARH
jgi:hypothetical protein